MAETLIAVGAMVVLLVAVMLGVSRLYIHVERGSALVVNTFEHISVRFTGAMVLPILHRSETMDISLKTLTLERRGKDGLVCGDKIRADIAANFSVRVSPLPEDVLRVAQAIGCARAGDPAVLDELFVAPEERLIH